MHILSSYPVQNDHVQQNVLGLSKASRSSSVLLLALEAAVTTVVKTVVSSKKSHQYDTCAKVNSSKRG